MSGDGDLMQCVVPVALTGKGVVAPALIVHRENRVDVRPFSGETAMTIGFGCPIALLRRDAVDEFLIDDIDQMVKRYPMGLVIEKLDTYFKASNLYADANCEACALKLILGGIEPILCQSGR